MPKNEQFTERQTGLMESILMAMVELRDVAAHEGGDAEKEEMIMRAIEENLTRLAYPSSDDE